MEYKSWKPLWVESLEHFFSILDIFSCVLENNINMKTIDQAGQQNKNLLTYSYHRAFFILFIYFNFL